MKKLICIVIGLIILVSVLTEAQAQEKKKSWSDPVTLLRPLKKAEQKSMAENMNLTPDQQAEIKTLSQKYMTDLKALADTYQNARQSLITALEADSPNSDSVEAELKQVRETHSALLEKEIEYWDSLVSALSDEQATQLWTLFAESRLKGAAKPTEEVVEPEEEM